MFSLDVLNEMKQFYGFLCGLGVNKRDVLFFSTCLHEFRTRMRNAEAMKNFTFISVVSGVYAFLLTG